VLERMRLGCSFNDTDGQKLPCDGGGRQASTVHRIYNDQSHPQIGKL
jgi:hypothetical protein